MNLSFLLSHRLRLAVTDILQLQKFRYLFVGGMNTLFGYGLGVSLYLALCEHLHIIVIGVIGNFIAITFSFTTQKLFVFRTAGHWLQEYLRSYVVYGGMAVFGIVILWLLVDGLGISIWAAQAMSLVIKTITIYFAHEKFTFRLPASSTPRAEATE